MEKCVLCKTQKPYGHRGLDHKHAALLSVIINDNDKLLCNGYKLEFFYSNIPCINVISEREYNITYNIFMVKS